MGLRDHKYPLKFKLDSNKRYKDDPEGKLYEIIKDTDGKLYLSFVMTAVQRAFHFDEALKYEKTLIGLRLMPDKIDSFTEIDNINLAILATVVILLSFLFAVWKFLPERITETIKGGLPEK